MEKLILVNGKMMLVMGRVFSNGWMEAFIMEIGLIIKKMGLELMSEIIMINILVNGEMIKLMEKDYFNGLMVNNMMEIGLII